MMSGKVQNKLNNIGRNMLLKILTFLGYIHLLFVSGSYRFKVLANIIIKDIH